MASLVLFSAVVAICTAGESDADGISAEYYDYNIGGKQYYEVEVTLDTPAIANVVGAKVIDSSGNVLGRQVGLFIQQGKTTGSLFLDAALADGVYDITAGDFSTKLTVGEPTPVPVPGPVPTIEISGDYTASIVEFGNMIYLAFIALDGKYIPAGDYTVIVSYLEYDDWADAMVVMEKRVTVTLDEPVPSGSLAKVDVPAISGIYAYTPEFTMGGDTVRGKTVLA